MVKLGKIMTVTKLSLLSLHQTLPRGGHLETGVHIMAYIGQKNNSRLVYTQTYPKIDHGVFEKCDLTDL